MPVSRDFLDYLADQLRGFGPITMRRMFSGAGLFRGDVMFGLVSRDVLHFKVNDANLPDYLAAGAKVFTYNRLGQDAFLTSYYEVPIDILEDPDLLAEWARRAWSAAQSKAKAKPAAAKKVEALKTRRRKSAGRRGDREKQS
jgi:DNA transformation protein and related proteins